VIGKVPWAEGDHEEEIKNLWDFSRRTLNAELVLSPMRILQDPPLRDFSLRWIEVLFTFSSKIL